MKSNGLFCRGLHPSQGGKYVGFGSSPGNTQKTQDSGELLSFSYQGGRFKNFITPEGYGVWSCLLQTATGVGVIALLLCNRGFCLNFTFSCKYIKV